MKSGSWANRILILSAMMLLVGYPFRDTFWGGCLTHTGMAALVGGLADGYAVTALFRKPLGIPWQTEWIPRTREKIIQMAVRMVTEEILIARNIYRVLRQESPFARLLAWLDKARPQVRRQVSEWLQNWPAYVDPEWLAAEWLRCRQSGFSQFRPELYLRLLILAFLQGGTASPHWQWWVHTCKRIVAMPEVAGWIMDMYDTWKREEEKQSIARSTIWTWWVETKYLHSKDIGIKCQEKAICWVESLSDPQSPATRWVQRELTGVADRLMWDTAWQDRIRRWVVPWLAGELCKWDAEQIWKEQVTPERAARAVHYLVAAAEAEWDAFLADPKRQAAAERIALALIARWLPRIQPLLGAAIERELRQYSGAEMAAMVESEVAADLQIIRINGTVIGGVLGLVSYVLLSLFQGGVR